LILCAGLGRGLGGYLIISIILRIADFQANFTKNRMIVRVAVAFQLFD
jgi:hypothetical protein